MQSLAFKNARLCFDVVGMTLEGFLPLEYNSMQTSR